MSQSLAALLGVHEAPRRDLVARQAIRSPLVLARAQAVSSATVFGAGPGWTEVGADVPRFVGGSGRLLIEGQRSNAFPNPRGEFAAAPTFPQATQPAGWNTSASGVTATVVGAGTVNGLPYVDIRYQSASAPGFIEQMFHGAAFGPSAGTVTFSVFVQHVGGSLAGVNAVQAFIPNFGSTPAALDGSLRRAAHTATLSAQRNPRARFELTAGAVLDFTVRFAAPQYESGAFASTPILPAPGSQVASTRGADLATATLTGLGLGPSGASTLFWSGVLPQAAPAGQAQTILQLDDGTQTNGFMLLNEAGGTSIVARAVSGGAASDIVLGSAAPGGVLRIGLALSGAGRLAATLNGGATQAVTGGPTGGLTTLRLGIDASGDRAMFGESLALQLHRIVFGDAALPAAALALPG